METWPATFGNTPAEYEAMHEGAGFVGGASALFWATGPDAVSFLQDIITQDVAGMEVGAVERSLLLEPRGKLAALLWLLRDRDRVGIVTDSAHLDETIASLTRWRFRVDVDFHVDSRPVFELWGPGADLGPDSGWSDEGGALIAVLSDGPIRRRLVVGLTAGDLETLGAIAVGGLVATTARIEVGEPRMGVDVGEKTIPQETGLVPEAVSFDKGCYLGQELVSRIDSRGHVNRHLRAVRLHAQPPPPAGAEVLLGETVVGLVTSVGDSLSLGVPVALALIRREAEPGSDVQVRWEGGSCAATVEALPLLALSS